MAERTTLLLGLGYLLGGAALAYQLWQPPATAPADDQVAPEPVAPLELPPIAVDSIAIYDAIIERPLFNAERRPQSGEAGEAAPADDDQPVEELDGFRLSAVLKGMGSTTALVEDPSGMTRTLREGDRVGNWELREIQDDRVVLVSDSRRETLLVYRFDAAPPPPVRPGVEPRRRIVPRPPRPPREPPEEPDPELQDVRD